MKNLNFSPKGTTTFNFGKETLFVADFENVKISAFIWLPAKSWLKKALFCGMFALLNE